jgi:hypothetical protein
MQISNHQKHEEVRSTTGEIWRQNLEISKSGQYQKIDINDFYTQLLSIIEKLNRRA